MRKFFLPLVMLPFVGVAQVPFWTEDFGAGCNQGLLYSAYAGPNGSWTVTSTGTNASSANTWYVSAMENGNGVGQCGTGCGNDRTLHVGNVALGAFGIAADNGASYYEGIAGFCGIFPCGATDKRVESPVINCTGKTNIDLQFLYIEGGNSIDNATLWYFNGSTWSQLLDMAKTFSSTCTPQGEWTQINVTLPASADNNANVKIGFRWVNNEDGDATDPSFAVDDIALSVEETTDTEPPVITCPGDLAVNPSSQCDAIVPDFTGDAVVSDNADPAPVVTQEPAAGTVVSSNTTIVLTATDNSGNSASCSFSFLIVDTEVPFIICPPNIVAQAPFGATEMMVTVPSATGTDNCGPITFSNDYNFLENASGIYPIGTTTVNYIATDAAGNSNTCAFPVIVLEPECCVADYNCDGVVNVADLLFFMGEYGTMSAAADLTMDGFINIADLLVFMGEFGNECN